MKLIPNVKVKVWKFLLRRRNSPTCARDTLFFRFLDYKKWLLWTSDWPVAETSTWQQTTLTGDRHRCALGDSNPKSQQAISRRPSPQTARLLESTCENLQDQNFYRNNIPHLALITKLPAGHICRTVASAIRLHQRQSSFRFAHLTTIKQLPSYTTSIAKLIIN
jgi:hypothetical protein